MKKEDKCTMQISTVHKFQKALDGTLKVLKFIWRHAFVLTVLGMMIAALLMYPALDWPMLVTELVIALGLDKFKMQFKPSPRGSNVAMENMFEYARRSRDSSNFGSSAWATNPAMAGSPANSLNNLGYMTTNYN